MTENNRILVGIDGGEGGRAAIAHAAGEAGLDDEGRFEKAATDPAPAV